MTQTDIARCLVELERLWLAQLASSAFPRLLLVYPNEAMAAWAKSQGIPHDPFNPWYQRDYARLRARLLAKPKLQDTNG